MFGLFRFIEACEYYPSMFSYAKILKYFLQPSKNYFGIVILIIIGFGKIKRFLFGPLATVEQLVLSGGRTGNDICFYYSSRLLYARSDGEGNRIIRVYC